MSAVLAKVAIFADDFDLRRVLGMDELLDPTAELLSTVWAIGYRGVAGISASFKLPNARAAGYAYERAGELITGLAETTRDDVLAQLRSLLGDTLSDPDVSADDLTAAIEAMFSDMADWRASMIADTELATAAGKGAAAGFGDTGVEAVLISDGTDSDQECADADGQVWSVDYYDDNVIEHPNAVLGGSTFVPYGGLVEMRRARYDGPAVRLTVAGNRTVTIGPNHPMLAKHGMTQARLLREGDELVYDRRHDDLTGAIKRGELQLEEIPAIEQVFESLLASGSHVRVPVARDDFHNDGMFCQGEVDVVWPAGELLHEWDLGLPEESRQLILAGADAQLTAKPGERSALASKERVLLAASRGVGGGGPGSTHFVLLPIESIEAVHYAGYAFDGSAIDSLYCSSGFVVTNCGRSASPLSEGEYDPAEVIDG